MTYYTTNATLVCVLSYIKSAVTVSLFLCIMYVSDRYLGAGATDHRVPTCLENLEMSGNLTAVRKMPGILLKIRELSGKNLVSCQGKVA